ncbi:MAG: hypothetical protein GY832_22240 [Chloroflexi bacterium]|nr:hypothetical protein [Chloroflexota bacterium]
MIANIVTWLIVAVLVVHEWRLWLRKREMTGVVECLEKLAPVVHAHQEALESLKEWFETIEKAHIAKTKNL